MIYKKQFLMAIPGLLTLLLFSCTSIQELSYRDFRNFKISNVGFATSSIKMNLIYYNPNNFGLQLKRTDLDIFVDNNYVGHTVQEYQISIPKRAEFGIPLQMDVDMKNLFKNTFNTIFSKEVKIKVFGTIKVGKANVFKSFPVNYEGVQKFDLF
mgnify:FL=1